MPSTHLCTSVKHRSSQMEQSITPLSQRPLLLSDQLRVLRKPASPRRALTMDDYLHLNQQRPASLVALTSIIPRRDSMMTCVQEWQSMGVWRYCLLFRCSSSCTLRRFCFCVHFHLLPYRKASANQLIRFAVSTSDGPATVNEV